MKKEWNESTGIRQERQPKEGVGYKEGKSDTPRALLWHRKLCLYQPGQLFFFCFSPGGLISHSFARYRFEQASSAKTVEHVLHRILGAYSGQISRD